MNERDLIEQLCKGPEGPFRVTQAPVGARRVVLCPRGSSARIPDSIVRRVRAMKLMGLRREHIAAICELSINTVAEFWLDRRRVTAGQPSDREILAAADIVARWAMERRDRLS